VGPAAGVDGVDLGQPPSQVLTRTVEWLPRTVTLVNYAKVMQKPVVHWLLNSTIATVASTAISLTTGAMAGTRWRGSTSPDDLPCSFSCWPC